MTVVSAEIATIGNAKHRRLAIDPVSGARLITADSLTATLSTVSSLRLLSGAGGHVAPSADLAPAAAGVQTGDAAIRDTC